MSIFVGVSEDIAGEFAFISLLKKKALKNVKNLEIDKHLKNNNQYNSVRPYSHETFSHTILR
jgi:hypothetical protein